MRYVIDIPPELADEINKLVKTGRYKTPQDFMLAALQNQAYLESVQAEGNSVSSAQTPVSSPQGSGDRLFETAIEYLRDADPASKTAQAKMLLPPEIGRVKTVPLTNALLRHKYISGLSNRLFPVKPVVRVLANLLAESGSEYVTLDDLQQKAADVAHELGRLVQRKDRSFGRKRGSIISAGLPVSREDKSRFRFQNQFVGYMSKRFFEGATPTLKFAELKRDGTNELIGLTEAGLKFCILSNPIIDKQDYSTPFSDEEVEFLLNHIATELEGEPKLIRSIIKSVGEGVATPDGLNPRIKSTIDRERISRKPRWTDNEIVAERVGLISRMNELGLIEREKDGVKVTYVLSPRGRSYLGKLTEKEA